MQPRQELRPRASACVAPALTPAACSRPSCPSHSAAAERVPAACSAQPLCSLRALLGAALLLGARHFPQLETRHWRTLPTLVLAAPLYREWAMGAGGVNALQRSEAALISKLGVPRGVIPRVALAFGVPPTDRRRGLHIEGGVSQFVNFLSSRNLCASPFGTLKPYHSHPLSPGHAHHSARTRLCAAHRTPVLTAPCGSWFCP